MSRRKTPEEFETQVRSVWGDSVELLTPYTRDVDKVLVRFKSCGHQQWKSPSKLIAGQGCGEKECYFGRVAKSKLHSDEEYSEMLLAAGLDYELLSEYKGRQRKIKVRNNKCGHVYEAQAGNILQGSGCPICHGMKDTDGFSKQLEDKYPGEYTVLGQYINNRERIKIRHNKCGYEWEVIPKDVLRRLRCPNCNKSYGERFIEEFLCSLRVQFKPQYKFDDCRDKFPLPFDFAVFQDGSIKLIEFDGTQHFDKRSFYATSRGNSIAEHDRIKNDYCESHGIPLLRIPYWQIKTPGSVERSVASFLDIEM